MNKKPHHLFFKTPLAIILLLIFCFRTETAPACRYSSHTFFEGTQYPLTVYYIQSENPGPTVMIQGGIQGDEPSGFLSGQLLTLARIDRGQLILVPRANEPSINQRKREVNVDLNRRFDKDYGVYYEDRLARVIRYLVGRCDAFIHLHEGSGFYSPVHVDSLENPRRYGQSIIIDADVYGEAVYLRDIAINVIEELNSRIGSSGRPFRLFNMNTVDDSTQYPEQRKSLSYYALTRVKIPALAIEVSKNISSLPWKVKAQVSAVQLFLKAFGINAQVPDLSDEAIRDYVILEKPDAKLNDIRLSISGSEKISIPTGTPVRISFDLGGPIRSAPSVFSPDWPGFNLALSPRLASPSMNELDFKADGKVISKLKLDFKERHGQKQGDQPRFLFWLNGELHSALPGRTIEAVVGDQLILEGIEGESGEIVNFKGFSSKSQVRGQPDNQDVGKEIILDPDGLMKQYALPESTADEYVFQVIRETRGKKHVGFNIRIVPRKVERLEFLTAGGETVHFSWNNGQTLKLPGSECALINVVARGEKEKITPFLNDVPLKWGDYFRLNDEKQLILRQTTTFAQIGSMTIRPALKAENAAPGAGDSSRAVLGAGNTDPDEG